MRTSESTAPATPTIRCANCGKIVRPGSRIVTTVTPGMVTTAHAVCPLTVKEYFDA